MFEAIRKKYTMSAILLLLIFGCVHCKVYQTTEVFTIPIEPTMFNWTMNSPDSYAYHASLLHAPDLPKWIQYLFSPKYGNGFLYGAPPRDINDIELEVIAMNENTYETRRRVVHLNVEEKSPVAARQVHLKIDNVNVDDLFDTSTKERLLDIFRHKLWKESYPDLYVTFLTSALNLGARLPLNPNEREGIVIRVGSSADFSTELIQLKEEVKPLWKLQYCPRDFKRTTVERLFRAAGFVLDWCNFKLLDDGAADEHHTSSTSSGGRVSSADSGEQEFYKPPRLELEDVWSRPKRDEIPVRSYVGEFFYTILIPMLIMVLLVLALSLILCFQHEGITKRNADESDVQMVQYAAVARATSTLRSLSSQRELTPELSKTMSTRSRSRTSSPSNNFHSNVEVNGYSRPTPPPYVGSVVRGSRVDF